MKTLYKYDNIILLTLYKYHDNTLQVWQRYFVNTFQVLRESTSQMLWQYYYTKLSFECCFHLKRQLMS